MYLKYRNVFEIHDLKSVQDSIEMKSVNKYRIQFKTVFQYLQNILYSDM